MDDEAKIVVIGLNTDRAGEAFARRRPVVRFWGGTRAGRQKIGKRLPGRLRNRPPYQYELVQSLLEAQEIHSSTAETRIPHRTLPVFLSEKLVPAIRPYLDSIH